MCSSTLCCFTCIFVEALLHWVSCLPPEISETLPEIHHKYFRRKFLWAQQWHRGMVRDPCMEALVLYTGCRGLSRAVDVYCMSSLLSPPLFPVTLLLGKLKNKGH
ncbi:hypothetical protein XENOCAPTIV_027131 [Xenoophorus captivus]|uniref:Secreted protein n=1 Tax=Xenoophorus captivus TaxID=1517983 RepID=A0ABV0SH36_9TELE